jgi:hypothetical protein
VSVDNVPYPNMPGGKQGGLVVEQVKSRQSSFGMVVRGRRAYVANFARKRSQKQRATRMRASTCVQARGVGLANQGQIERARACVRATTRRKSVIVRSSSNPKTKKNEKVSRENEHGAELVL